MWFPAAAGTGSNPEGQRPLGRHRLYCTPPAAARVPSSFPEAPASPGAGNDGLQQSSWHPHHYCSSTTAVFEVRLGSRSPVGGL